MLRIGTDYEDVFSADKSDGETVAPHFQRCFAKDRQIRKQPQVRFARRGFVALLWLAALCMPEALFGLNATAALPLLTTCRSVHHLTVAEANIHRPVRLHAVVSYYEAAIDATGPSLFVVDKSGSVFVSLGTIPAKPLVPGDLVEVTGVSSGADYAPVVAHGATRVIGKGRLPSTAPRVNVTDMLSGAKDGQWVEIEAVVDAVHRDGAADVLALFMQGGMILARTPVEPGVDYKQLIDAKILLRGNAAPLFNHQQQITGGIINFPGISSLSVEQPADPNPFSLPLSSIAGLLRYTPDSEIRHRVHLRGRVTLFWPGRMLCFRDETESLCAQVDQTTTIGPGDWTDVIGFPNAGEFKPTLIDATFKKMERSQPVFPVRVNNQQALSGEHEAELVSMEGKVIGEDAGASDPTVILSAQGNVFSIVAASAAGTKPQHPEFGSFVRATGICSMETDGAADSTRAGFPIAKSFRILLRSPADVVVLQTPSWWNAVHTLRVLALALALAIFALCRMALLSHRVHRQTETIRTQLLEAAELKNAAERATVAAEFHAAHDELTGTRNRRKIFAEFQREFDAATASGSTLGVIMVDLDHFKRVNDTYGHLTGDEILRETVRRITFAVRSSDLVGRYGGEEFMIVLPRCDKFQLQACAERIRLAIASEPMMVGSVSISMTTSVGTAVTMRPPHAMLDALAAADSALYQAKNGGRNRVVLKDLATGAFEEAYSGVAGV